MNMTYFLVSFTVTTPMTKRPQSVYVADSSYQQFAKTKSPEVFLDVDKVNTIFTTTYPPINLVLVLLVNQHPEHLWFLSEQSIDYGGVNILYIRPCGEHLCVFVFSLFWA